MIGPLVLLLAAPPSPEPAAMAAAPQPQVDSVPASAPRFKGTGLFVSAGLLSAGALAMSALAAADTCDHYEDCNLFAPAFSNGAALANLVALPLVTIGGVKRARFDTARKIRRKNNPRLIGLGLGMFGAGLVGSAVLRTFSARHLPCQDYADNSACTTQWNRGSALGAFAFETAAIAGAGLLSYSWTMRRGATVSMQPFLGPSSGGLALQGSW